MWSAFDAVLGGAVEAMVSTAGEGLFVLYDVCRLLPSPSTLSTTSEIVSFKVLSHGSGLLRSQIIHFRLCLPNKNLLNFTSQIFILGFIIVITLVSQCCILP